MNMRTQGPGAGGRGPAGNSSRKACRQRRLKLPVVCGVTLLAFFVVLASCVLSPSRAISIKDDSKTPAGASGLLEVGSHAKTTEPPAAAPAEIKLVCYNMRWRGGDDLKKLIALLRDDAEIGGAALIGLQEVDRGKERTDRINTARVMAEALGMHYAWAAPPRANGGAREDETGVAILSRYPLTDVERLVLPHAGPGGRRRAGIGATARVGAHDVRLYSLHAETRIPMEKKMEQIGAALEDLKRYPQVRRAVVLGDFNTIKAKDVAGARRIFTKADFVTPFADDRATWKTLIFELKLDGFWLRGMEPTASGIVRRIKLSDHWPLWASVKL